MGGGRQGEVMVFEDPKKKTGRAEPGAALRSNIMLVGQKLTPSIPSLKFNRQSEGARNFTLGRHRITCPPL